MKFKCIKTVEIPIYPQNNPVWHKKSSPSRYPFIEGEIYESWDENTCRTKLELIDESGYNHGVGRHWLYWGFNNFFKEHFIKVE